MSTPAGRPAGGVPDHAPPGQAPPEQAQPDRGPPEHTPPDLAPPGAAPPDHAPPDPAPPDHPRSDPAPPGRVPPRDGRPGARTGAPAISVPSPWDAAAAALAFLTAIPVRPRGDGGDLRRAAAWFPVVGALVGALAGATRACAEPLFGPTVASVLALVVLVGVTGALHEDGLADCADGLGVRGDRARRLAVMRDSAIGVFGALALLGWALLLVAALAALSDHAALRALVSAAIVGRWAALLHGAATSPARDDGLGASFAVARGALVVASVTTIVAVVLLDGPLPGLVGAVAGAAVACAISGWARATLGGRTGDTLGATVALGEVAVCLALLAFATA